MAESELSAGQRYSADLDEDDSSGGESSDDEDEAERAGGRGVQQEEERGMVDDSMISGAAQARKLFVSRGGAGAAAGKGPSAGLSAPAGSVGGAAAGERPPSAAVKTERGPAVKSALKRPREETGAVEDAVKEESGASSKAAKVSFQQQGNGSSAETGPAASAPPSADGPAKAQSAVEYPLTEQGFRLFLRHRGGKVLPTDMNVRVYPLYSAVRLVLLTRLLC
jgi:hypothetical protein